LNYFLFLLELPVLVWIPDSFHLSNFFASPISPHSNSRLLSSVEIPIRQTRQPNVTFSVRSCSSLALSSCADRASSRALQMQKEQYKNWQITSNLKSSPNSRLVM
jgi:hypothetical protein